MSVNNLIEHLTLTEQEIIAIIRRNDEHFARRVLAFVFGLDKAMWKKKKDLELDVESSVRMEDET
nr:MAG TPA: Protein similar to CwfJ C-terminus 2 [Caudoviricetes sp.]